MVSGYLVMFSSRILFHGQSYVTFQIQQNLRTLGESPQNLVYAIGSLAGILLIYLNELTFSSVPFVLNIIVIGSARLVMVFPMICFSASIVAWHRRQLPLMYTFRSVENNLYTFMLIINKKVEAGHVSHPNVPTERALLRIAHETARPH
jgi:hypothetical protein